LVGILKYGVGNIFSLLNIFEEKNIPCKFIISEDDFTGVTHVILPGVGSFDYALEMFEKSGLKAPLLKLVKTNKVFGCAKPFKLVRVDSMNYIAEKCDYI